MAKKNVSKDQFFFLDIVSRIFREIIPSTSVLWTTGACFCMVFCFYCFLRKKRKNEKKEAGRIHEKFVKFVVIGYTLFLVIFLMFLKIFALGHVLNFCALLLQLFTTFSSFWHCVFLLRFFVCLYSYQNPTPI